MEVRLDDCLAERMQIIAAVDIPIQSDMDAGVGLLSAIG